MKKRLLAIVFALFAVHAAIWAQSGYCGDPKVNGGKDVTWELENNTLIISGTGDMASWDDLDARPWNSYANSIKYVRIEDGVTSISDASFVFCEGLVAVEGGFDVEYIGNEAFAACVNLKIAPEIIASADRIGVGAFAECHSLEGEYGGGLLFLTASLVGEGAFMKCPKIDGVALFGGNQEIGRGAFYGCTGLETLVLGIDVKSIGDEAFAGCENLVKVEVEAPVPPMLGEDVFEGIHPEAELVFESYIIADFDMMYAYATSDWAKYFEIQVQVPPIDSGFCAIDSGFCGDPNVNEGKDVKWELSIDSVLTISGVGAMEDYGYVRVVWGGVIEFDRSPWCGDDRVTSVVVKEGITNIGDGAFRECVKIESVELPTSCTIIGDSAFCGCVALDSIVIPEGVTSIGNYAFYCCTGLTSVTIPNSVTSIGESAFDACLELATITIPEGVTEISTWTFAECISMKSITLPKTLENIDVCAFAHCLELETIVIPENVVSIAGRVFEYCPKLSEVTCLNPIPPVLGEDPFIAISPTAILRVPDVEAYKASDWAKYFPTIVDLDMDITAINGVEAEQMKSTTIYDLSGRRVHTPVKGRIYVVNNKVVMW